MFEKKGQFTIFVVLGIVILAAVLFALLMRNFFIRQSLFLEAEANVEEALRINNVDFYVESCLNRISEDAVQILALQGGRIYESQGGVWRNPTAEGWDFIEVNNSNSFINITFYNYSNVSYAVVPNYNHTCIKTSPPHYPFPNASLEVLKTLYHTESIVVEGCDVNSGVAGLSVLPKLCDPNGSNRLNATGNNYSNFFHGRCIFGYENKSVQQELEEYTATKLKECVDLSIFENIGSNISLQGNASVIYIFTDNSFTVKANYPLNVKVRNKNVQTIAEFEKKKNIRLKKSYEYIQRLLEKEYKDIYFNFEKEYEEPKNGWDQAITLSRISNLREDYVGNGKYDDLFQIIDNASRIRGSPLIFQFLIKNRAPILDYIDSGQRYNIVVKEGDLIEIKPFGIDPDENILEYNYTGWKEEKNAYFNEAGCLANIVQCETNPEDFVIKTSDAPHNWSTSEDYRNTRQNASYKTNRSDLGLHHTEVWIRDEEGKYDFQNISIMVFDVPQINLEADNKYSDIGNRNASLEDPYFPDAQTISIFTNILQFHWHDPLDPFDIYTTSPQITIPESYDIDNIKENHFLTIGLRNLEVKGEYQYQTGTEWTAPNSLQVEVHECLPHRDMGAPYPYNENPDVGIYNNMIIKTDPYQSNHTCCSGEQGTWGELMDGTTICYHHKEWSSYVKLNNTRDKFVTGDYPTINPDKYDEVNLEGDNKYQLNNIQYLNNIWYRKFMRRCDGERGNICNGTADIQVYSYQNCNYEADFEEQCSGPSENIGFENNDPGCVNYGQGKTFEKIFLDGTGSCNHEEKCSGVGPGQYDIGGIWLCNATCSGDGSCTTTTLSICHDCRQEDLPADDPEENNCGSSDCPTQANNCEDGISAACNNANGCQLTTMPPTQIFIERCIYCPGLSCRYEEYFTADNNGGGIKESCELKEYDPDDYQEICESAPGCNTASFQWFSSNSGQLRCCGDDWECINQETGECVPDGMNSVEWGVTKQCYQGNLV